MDQATEGKLIAVEPTATAGSANADTSLPDPTLAAKVALAGLLLLAAAVAVILNAFELTSAPFNPAEKSTANFALFAGFYIAAQVIERLLETVSPLLPPWPVPGQGAVRAAHVKADRAALVLGVATLAGVGASCGFGLYFLASVGIAASNTVDAIATGLTIGAGTKPLHDLITNIQNKSTPTTGSSASD